MFCAYGRPRERAEVANCGRNAGGRLVFHERRAGQSAKVAERDSLRHREMPLRNQELLERLHVGSGRAERKVAGKGGGGACFLNGNFCLKRNHLREKRGMNKATVALANKLTRIGWAILRNGTTYQPAQAS